jgi:tetratricopeptide (TPR) repeat protein
VRRDLIARRPFDRSAPSSTAAHSAVKPVRRAAPIVAIGLCAAIAAGTGKVESLSAPQMRAPQPLTPFEPRPLPAGDQIAPHPHRAGMRQREPDRHSLDPAAAFERGIAAYNVDDADAAADAFEEAIRLAPDQSEPHINLGLIYLRLQRPEDAMRELALGASLAKPQDVR